MNFYDSPEFATQLIEYVRGEMPGSTKESFLAKVNACPICKKRLENETYFQSTLRKQIRYQRAASPSLLENIRQQIAQAQLQQPLNPSVESR